MRAANRPETDDRPLPPGVSQNFWEHLEVALEREVTLEWAWELAGVLYEYVDPSPMGIRALPEFDDELEAEAEHVAVLNDLDRDLKGILTTAQYLDTQLELLAERLPENAKAAKLKRHRSIPAVRALIGQVEAWLAAPECELPRLLHPKRGRGHPGNDRRERLVHRTMHCLKRHGIPLTDRNGDVLARVLREAILPAADRLDGRRKPGKYRRLDEELKRWLATLPRNSSHHDE